MINFPVQYHLDRLFRNWPRYVNNITVINSTQLLHQPNSTGMAVCVDHINK
jgi:hypothetical protein